MTQPWLFALAVLAILATPGPTNMLLATGGAIAGVRRSLPLVAAEALGYGLASSAIGLVLRPALERFPLIAAVARILVGIYLLSLAWRLFGGLRAAPAGGGRVVTPRQVFVATLLNPKAIVFGLTVIPFGRPHAGFYLLGFAAILVPVSIGWLSLGAVLGAASARKGRLPWIARAGALVIAMFAALILASGVRGVAVDGVAFIHLYGLRNQVHA